MKTRTKMSYLTISGCVFRAVFYLTGKQLKRMLGKGYRFENHLSKREVREICASGSQSSEALTVSTLTAGCVRLEMVLYPGGSGPVLGYNVFVKDSPDTPEWIYYDSVSKPVSFREKDMLMILDRIVRRDGLSYTECCFNKLDPASEIKTEKGKGLYSNG